ncbi:MAG: hypothetical protein AAGP08_04530 [Pseudomonadota bacterium]
MSELSLVKTRLQAGIWEGVLSGALGTGEAPEILVTHLEKPVTSVAVTADTESPGTWNVKIAIPPDLLSDGVQTFLIWDPVSNQKLASFAIVTGEPLEDDIRAELDLMRAELDMLKKAFRRHCVETS